VPVMGRAGIALIATVLHNMMEGGYVSEHDRKIGLTLATILSGGDVPGPTTVSEQHLLDLERESFVRLCGSARASSACKRF
jgi:3-hydroxyacyl-CoA dehydrogenase